MWRKEILLFSVLALGRTMLAQQSAPTAFDPSRSDPQAIKVAEELAQSLGGMEAWRRVHFLRYDWIIERDGKPLMFQHLYDKYTGRYRVEGTGDDGENVIVLFNVNSKKGTAYVNGKGMAAADRTKWIDFGYQHYINDGYWLYMPFKWKEPGVQLKYEGEATIAGKTYDIVQLSYDSAGLMPENIYWGYVNKQTRLMDQWRFGVKGQQRSPTIVNWSGWKRYGEVLLASERTFLDNSNQKIYFRNLGIYSQVEDKYFTDPNAKLTTFEGQ